MAHGREEEGGLAFFHRQRHQERHRVWISGNAERQCLIQGRATMSLRFGKSKVLRRKIGGLLLARVDLLRSW